jgi:hypothetical protein
MKKFIFPVIGIIFLLVAITLFTDNSITNGLFNSLLKPCPREEDLGKNYNIGICDQATLEDEVIIQRLVVKWLQKYTPEDSLNEVRLSDYKVVSIDMMNNLSSPNGIDVYPLGAQVTYSVLPYLEATKSNWIAPDGRLGENGWIINKKMYVGVINHKNGIYELKLLGQCISC